MARKRPDPLEPSKVTRAPLTIGGAALVSVLGRYSEQTLRVDVGEVQKLMYFLQEAGQDLGLKFVTSLQGPHSDELRRILTRLESRNLVRHGDRDRPTSGAQPIRVLGDAATGASQALDLSSDPDLSERIDRTLELAHGFESAYGLELLARVHWCTTRTPAGESAKDIVECVRAANNRNGRMFTEEHIAIAWDHLRDQGWLDQRRPVLG